VDEYLHRAGIEQRGDARGDPLIVAEVECDGFGLAAAGANLLDERAGPLDALVRMDDHVRAVGRQRATDRGADPAAAAGDERPAWCCVLRVACAHRTGSARVAMISRPRASSPRALQTRKPYWLPASVRPSSSLWMASRPPAAGTGSAPSSSPVSLAS